LIVQPPVPASTAPDDDKFQHRSAKHRTGQIIPHRERFACRAGWTTLMFRGARLNPVLIAAPSNNGRCASMQAGRLKIKPPPAREDRRGRVGKMVRGGGVPRCRAKDPPWNQPYGLGSGKTIL
jgi:hypothetical protein